MKKHHYIITILVIILIVFISAFIYHISKSKNKKTKYDAIILSGILQNFDDFELHQFVKYLKNVSHEKTYLLIRVSIATNERINVINQYSDALDALYTAYYRTKKEINNNQAPYNRRFRCLC